MQLNKLGTAAGLLLTALLSACGGGGDEEAPAAAAPAPPVLVSAAALNSTTVRAIVNTEVQFDGGTCSGGTAPYAPAAWNYGDGTGTTNKHTYTVPGTYAVSVTCTDSQNVSKTSTPFSVVVFSEAYAGFLGKTWSTYAAIDPYHSPTDVGHRFLYPVAGIVNSGSIYGLWLQNNADPINNLFTVTDVAAGGTSFNSNSWAFATTTVQSNLVTTFDGTSYLQGAATMDMAVSPSGKALAAWRSGTTLSYATIDGSGVWTTTSTTIAINDASIKVVVNDDGNGAIAYCTGTGAAMVTYTNAGNTLSPAVTVSDACDAPVGGILGGTQRARAFDIAIENKLTPYVNKVMTAGVVANHVYVNAYSLAGALNSTFDASGALTSTTDFSLSYALSPNGDYAGITWNDNNNVFARIDAAGAWGPKTPVQTQAIYTFSKPLIAVNDAGQAFLAMERAPTTNSSNWTVLSNYASATGWSSTVAADGALATSGNFKFNATDIAIDRYGTGLLTRVGGYGVTQAGTLAADGTWSGFATLSPAYTRFHYQTMRALPDGRAILVTSTGAAPGNLTPPSSGYLLLK